MEGHRIHRKNWTGADLQIDLDDSRAANNLLIRRIETKNEVVEQIVLRKKRVVEDEWMLWYQMIPVVCGVNHIQF